MFFKRRVRTAIRKHLTFSRFFVVGSFNTLLDFLLFFVFANLLHITPVAASLLSTSLTMCVSFYLNHHFVFQSGKKKRQTALQFFTVTAFNVWLVQSGVIALVIRLFSNVAVFHTHTWTLNMFAKLCGVTVSFILNFLMYRYIFHSNHTAESTVL